MIIFVCLPACLVRATRINPSMCVPVVGTGTGAVPCLLRRPQVADEGTLSCLPARPEGEDDAEQDAATKTQWFKHADDHSEEPERRTAPAAESVTTWIDRDAV
jgi:hypothetical protein